MARLLRHPWLVAAALFALVLGLYWRTGEFAFLDYDDDVYVTRNPAVQGGLALDGVRWAFTTGHAANWHPLTWLSHQLDVALSGLDAGAHHRTSAVLHALNAALLFAALRALTGASGKSALVAALFALHPLRVESVAWVAERKDVLAGSFFCACLWAYAAYARRGGAGRYLLCLALFALGLMAKPMLVTLPFLLLMLDVWPLRRMGLGKPEAQLRASPPSLAPISSGVFDAGRHPGEPVWTPEARSGYGLFLEKLPFLALALASTVVTLLVQRAGGALRTLDVIGPGARLANALGSAAVYVGKTLWPSGLCVFYPHPALLDPAPGSRAVWLALSVLVLLTAAALCLRRRLPAVAVGWLWFLGMLAPVAGLVQVGLQAWADRYSYLPTIGLFVALVWGLDRAATGPIARRTLAAAAALALSALGLASARQIDTWRDTRTLFEHALSVDEHNFVAHVELGQALEEQGELEGAAAHFARALELRPSLFEVHVNLARVRREQGRSAEARAELERALAGDPALGEAHADLGWLLYEIDRDGEALPHLRAAVELRPADLALRNNLAWVLATSRDHAAPEEALAIAQELCRATGFAQPGFLETLAAALARLGRFDEAARRQAEALASPRVPAARRALLQERLELYRAKKPCLKSP